MDYQGQGQVGGYVQTGISNGGSNYPATLTTANNMTPLDELSKQLDVVGERLGKAAGRLRSVGDALVGARPEKEAGALTQPNRPGRLGSLNDQADRLQVMLTYIEAEVTRLESIG